MIQSVSLLINFYGIGICNADDSLADSYSIHNTDTLHDILEKGFARSP